MSSARKIFEAEQKQIVAYDAVYDIRFSFRLAAVFRLSPMTSDCISDGINDFENCEHRFQANALHVSIDGDGWRCIASLFAANYIDRIITLVSI